MDIAAWLPLVGVIVGWSLKSLSEYFVARAAERQTFRRATYYLLRSFKALLDYDRGSEYFRQSRPTIDEFEPWRARLHGRLQEMSERNAETTSAALELLATADPTAAARLHNTLANIEFAFRRNLAAVAEADPATYQGMLKTLDDLIHFTLDDLRTAALSAAARVSFLERRRVNRWLEERDNGSREYFQGLDDQKALRDKAVSIPDKSVPPTQP